MSSSGNIVSEWLRSLHLGQYAESFIDNGYDDLEICKQVGDPDLDAIGVFNPSHRRKLLQCVRTLREEGAASVYLTLEASTAIHDECMCDSSSARSSHTSSGRDKGELLGAQGGATNSPGGSSNDSAQELGKYLDEYEEGKAELVKIPRIQLKMLLREKLAQDGIRLSCQPYSTSAGERGFLEGLASRCADIFNTHYGDVLEHLEDLRRREWEDLSPRIRVLVGTTPDTPPSPAEGYPPCAIIGQHAAQAYHGLTTSHSQPIYVPGKYSPSSCLSDKEEDEIYGFGYGVYGKQMRQRQQQQHKIIAPQPNYQSCLSPRSAYFYEFPPGEQVPGNQNTKKKTSFSRFLRGLKTATGHRKDKHGGSPRHRVGTPDSALGGGESMVAPSPCDPRDYDRLRCLKVNGGAVPNFEETIHRLKVQEVLKKRERFHKEHEEILRDIRHGLMQMEREGLRVHPDDTYMYDDDARCAGLTHWYDEPPFESDPEDFLMDVNGTQQVPAAHYRNNRVCFTLNLRPESNGEGVISLRSAGDISLPRDLCPNGGPSWLAGQQRGSARRGLLTIVDPGPHSRNRESGDYAGSDVHSISSRLSMMSVETSRSEQVESSGQVQSPSYVTGGKTRPFRKGSSYKCRSSASEEGPSHSSDYEDQEEGATTQTSRSSRHERKLARLRACASGQTTPEGSTGSGSSTQALVQANSNPSSISADDRDLSPMVQPPSNTQQPINIIGTACALVDYTPSPYDKDALKFKKGDIIGIISMNASGLWTGIAHNRIGTFKFINVEMLPDKCRKTGRVRKYSRMSEGKPQTVEELLKRINLEEHISVFVLNGYEDLHLFKDLEGQDLDYLGITNAEHRTKILTAIQLLNEADSESAVDTEGHGSSSDEERPSNPSSSSSSFRRLHFPRDSGCYDASNRRDGAYDKHRSKTTQRHRNHKEMPNNLDSGLIAYHQSLQAITKECIPMKTFKTTESPKSPDKHLILQNFLPNIPVSSTASCDPTKGHSGLTVSSPSRTLDSYVIARGKLVTVEPCRKNSAPTVVSPVSSLRKKMESAESEVKSDDMCEMNSKLTMVRYVVGGGTNGCEPAANVSKGCLSEKSSDSGISSSSLSSANPRETVKKLVPTLPESPTRGFVNFGCGNNSNRSSPTSKAKECV